MESQIIIKHTRKCFIGKIINPWISDGYRGINIIPLYSWVSCIVYGKLTKLSNKLPVPLVGSSGKSVTEIHVQIRKRANIFRLYFEAIKDHLRRDYIHPVSTVVGGNQPHYTLIVNIKDSWLIICFWSNFDVRVSSIGPNFPINDF